MDRVDGTAHSTQAGPAVVRHSTLFLKEPDFHALRHTFVPTYLQHWLGHTTPKMLLEVYAHYIPAHGVTQWAKLVGYLAGGNVG